MSGDTPHLCAEPWCTNIVEGVGRCPEHRSAESGTAGYGYAWRKIRDAYFAAHPTCETPGCGQAGRDVHHRDGRHPWDPGANAWSNLETLCRSCHRLATERQARSLGDRQARQDADRQARQGGRGRAQGVGVPGGVPGTGQGTGQGTGRGARAPARSVVLT